MPRKAPDKVTEHRITLGAYERTQLETALKAEKFRDYSEAAVNGILAGGVVAIGVGAVYGGYALWKWINEDWLENVLPSSSAWHSPITNPLGFGIDAIDRTFEFFGGDFNPFKRTIDDDSIWNPLTWW